MGVRVAVALYVLGVAAAMAAGFLSPAPWLGFLPLAAGLLWAAFDLVEVRDDDDDVTATPSG